MFCEPLGPYILCPLMDIRSTFQSATLMGIFPTAWAASVWRKTPFERQMRPGDGKEMIMQLFNMKKIKKINKQSNHILKCYKTAVIVPQVQIYLTSTDLLIKVETLTNLSDGLFDSDLIVHGHHWYQRGVRTNGSLQHLHMKDTLLNIDRDLSALSEHVELSSHSVIVPQDPPIHSSGLVSRWHRILQPPRFDMNPRHTCAPSEWWSRDASWPGRTSQRPSAWT